MAPLREPSSPPFGADPGRARPIPGGTNAVTAARSKRGNQRPLRVRKRMLPLPFGWPNEGGEQPGRLLVPPSAHSLPGPAHPISPSLGRILTGPFSSSKEKPAPLPPGFTAIVPAAPPAPAARPRRGTRPGPGGGSAPARPRPPGESACRPHRSGTVRTRSSVPPAGTVTCQGLVSGDASAGSTTEGPRGAPPAGGPAGSALPCVGMAARVAL